MKILILTIALLLIANVCLIVEFILKKDYLIAFIVFIFTVLSINFAIPPCSNYLMEKNATCVEAKLEGINPRLRYGMTSIGFVRFADNIPIERLYSLRKYQDSTLVFRLADNPKETEKMVFDIQIP